MKCTILGGGGFIGSHLTDALLASAHEVTVLDRPDARYLDYVKGRGARIVTGSCFEPQDLRPALSRCDVLFHLASTTVPQTSNENPSLDVQTNVLGALVVLEAARTAGIRKIVFPSSGGTVYGIPQEIPIKESHPTEPTSSYGIGKLAVEKYLYLYSTLHGLDYCILRISNAYGVRQPITATQGVIAAFLEKALRHQELVIWGDGSIVRDYIYATDIASALSKSATYEGEHKILNIGTGQGHSLNDIVTGIEQVIRQPLRLKYLPSRTFDVPTNVLDISRATTFLDWQPAVGLQDGIARTYEWALQSRQ